MKKYLASIFVAGIFLIPLKGFSWSLFGPDLDGILESQETAYSFLKTCNRRDTLNSCEEYKKKFEEAETEVDNHREAIDECASEGNSKCKKILDNLGALRKADLMLIFSK
jgi:hypothetical protein